MRPGCHLQRSYLGTLICNVSRENRHHPVKNYLGDVEWDGKPRLDTWLSEFCGVTDTPYTRAVGAKWLLAGVARIYDPGCKFDQVLILEGEQGVGKSTVFRCLAGPELFTDAVPIGGTDQKVIEQTRGIWIVELAELAGISRKDTDHTKQFISRQVDRSRLAYGRFVTNAPRQFIIGGSVNDYQYLRDMSGNRRFWPVRVNEIDLPSLKRDRDQLWAEAKHRYGAGESIQLPKELWKAAAIEQDKRAVLDPWIEDLEAALGDDEGKVSSDRVWEHLGIKANRQDGNVGQRLLKVMHALGFEKRRLNINGKRQVCFVRGPANDACLEHLLRRSSD